MAQTIAVVLSKLLPLVHNVPFAIQQEQKCSNDEIDFTAWLPEQTPHRSRYLRRIYHTGPHHTHRPSGSFPAPFSEAPLLPPCRTAWRSPAHQSPCIFQFISSNHLKLEKMKNGRIIFSLIEWSRDSCTRTLAWSCTSLRGLPRLSR